MRIHVVGRLSLVEGTILYLWVSCASQAADYYKGPGHLRQQANRLPNRRELSLQPAKISLAVVVPVCFVTGYGPAEVRVMHY